MAVLTRHKSTVYGLVTDLTNIQNAVGLTNSLTYQPVAGSTYVKLYFDYYTPQWCLLNMYMFVVVNMLDLLLLIQFLSYQLSYLSLRIKKVFDEVYFKETQIVNKNYVTEGMTKYYVWQYLTPKTPCVLLEMGEAKDPHDSILLNNTELIASGIVRSICKAFNVAYDIVSEENCKEILSSKDEQIAVLKSNTDLLQEKINELMAKNKEYQKSIQLCQAEVLTANEQVGELTKQLGTVTSDRS